METGLRGKGALVAAASAGIGLAIARGLAREGARVALLARRRDALERAATAVRQETGTDAHPIVCDLTDRDAVRRSVAEADAACGGLEILITNAGGPRPGGFLDVAPEDFEATARLTLMSAVWLCHETVPRMVRAGKGGRIVMVASVSAKQPLDGLILSNTLRPGVVGLAKSLADELGPRGIRVNVICPGFAATARLEELAAEAAARRGLTVDAVRAEWAGTTALRRIGAADEIADLAVYLASDRSSYVTGTAISVDGGRTRGLY